MNKKYTTLSKKKTSFKTLIFWLAIGAITLFCIIFVIVKFQINRKVNSYDSLDNIKGNQVFTIGAQTDTYLVFVYSSSGEKESEYDDFDKLMFNYITYSKKHGDLAGVYKIYGFDIDNPENKKAIISSTGSKKESVSDVEQIDDLRIYSENVPMLLVISGNVVDDYKDSDNAISGYLQDIMDANK